MDQLLLKDRALASVTEGITIADALAPDRPFISVNEGFARLTGYSIEETLGSNCRFLQGQDTDPAVVTQIRDAVKAERGCEVELLNYRKCGTPFWNHLSITPIRNSAGQATHFVGIQSDVTRRRQAEDRLRDANKRMQANLLAAARVQQALLPTELPELPQAKFGWSYLPCDELAGDVLDVFQLDDQRVAFYVLDVSGHGVQAALLATTLSRWLSRAANSLKADVQTAARAARIKESPHGASNLSHNKNEDPAHKENHWENVLNSLVGRRYKGKYVCDWTCKPGAEVEDPKIHFAYGYATQVVILDEEGRVSKVVAAHDAGRIMNRLLFEGQIEGAIHMGLGYAQSEDLPMKDGRPLSDMFKDLGILRSDEMPEVEVIGIEVPDQYGPYGAKGIGEIGMVPTAAAVVNALTIFDNNRRYTLPATKNKTYK